MKYPSLFDICRWPPLSVCTPVAVNTKSIVVTQSCHINVRSIHIMSSSPAFWLASSLPSPSRPPHRMPPPGEMCGPSTDSGQPEHNFLVREQLMMRGRRSRALNDPSRGVSFQAGLHTWCHVLASVACNACFDPRTRFRNSRNHVLVCIGGRKQSGSTD